MACALGGHPPARSLCRSDDGTHLGLRASGQLSRVLPHIDWRVSSIRRAARQLLEMTLLRAEARRRRMEITSDDKIWYGDYAGGFLGRYDPESGKVDEWQLPGGADARPYAMVRDDEDRVWVVETSRPNRFVPFDARTLQFSEETQVPSGGGVMRHMFYDPRTKGIRFRP